MITDINSEDRLVQQTFADHLRDRLGWESVYAYNSETFGPLVHREVAIPLPLSRFCSHGRGASHTSHPMFSPVFRLNRVEDAGAPCTARRRRFDAT